jgi:hemin uptake protein HemP
MFERRPRAPATSTGQEPLPAGDASQLRVRAVPSIALFGARREILIEHAGSLYHLRITQNNKLILTK